jgi:hypothetical protein
VQSVLGVMAEQQAVSDEMAEQVPSTFNWH